MARQEGHARGQDALLASLRSCAPVRHVRLAIAPLENDGVNNIPIQYFTKRKWEEVLPCTSQQLYFNGRVLRARRSGGFRMSDLKYDNIRLNVILTGVLLAQPVFQS